MRQNQGREQEMKGQGTETIDELRQRIAELEALTTEQNTLLLSAISNLTVEEKEMEKELKAVLDIRVMLKSAHCYIYAKDKEGRYTLSSRAHARFLGVESPERVVGRTPFDFFSQELAAQYQDDDRKIIQTGQPLPAREEIAMDAHGDKVWKLTTKVPLQDKKGEIVGLVGISHDITERKRAEEKLCESEARFATVSRLVSDYAYSYAVDEEGHLSLEWITDGFTRITGYTPEHLQTKETGKDLLHPDDRAVAERHERTLLAGKEDTSEFRMITKGGDIVWLREYSQPVWDEEKERIVHIVGASRDITEQVRAEEDLRHYHENLEEEVRERTAELRMLLDAMAGREIRMVELKEVIERLRAQLQEAGLEPVANDPLLEGDG